jgi:hypothetical protein
MNQKNRNTLFDLTLMFVIVIFATMLYLLLGLVKPRPVIHPPAAVVVSTDAATITPPPLTSAQLELNEDFTRMDKQARMNETNSWSTPGVVLAQAKPKHKHKVKAVAPHDELGTIDLRRAFPPDPHRDEWTQFYEDRGMKDPAR